MNFHILEISLLSLIRISIIGMLWMVTLSVEQSLQMSSLALRQREAVDRKQLWCEWGTAIWQLSGSPYLRTSYVTNTMCKCSTTVCILTMVLQEEMVSHRLEHQTNEWWIALTLIICLGSLLCQRRIHPAQDLRSWVHCVQSPWHELRSHQHLPSLAPFVASW